MGQRLNIAVLINGKTQFNCYFHWSGYTRSALTLSKSFMDEYAHVFEMCRVNVLEGRMEKMPKRKSMALATALRAWVGSGIMETDPMLRGKALSGNALTELLDGLGYDTWMIPMAVAMSRNDGLIGVTPKAIVETEQAEEFRVEIELGQRGQSKIARFDVWDIETISTYKEDFGKDPQYLEVKTGVLKYYRDPICAPRVDEILYLLDQSPCWAIGCKREDKMLVEVA